MQERVKSGDNQGQRSGFEFRAKLPHVASRVSKPTFHILATVIQPNLLRIGIFN